MGKHKRLLFVGAILLLTLIGGGLWFLFKPAPDVAKFAGSDKCQATTASEVKALRRSDASGIILERAGICMYNEGRYEEAKQLYEAAKAAFLREDHTTDAARVEQYIETTDSAISAKTKPAQTIDDLPPPRVTQPGEIKDE